MWFHTSKECMKAGKKKHRTSSLGMLDLNATQLFWDLLMQRGSTMAGSLKLLKHALLSRCLLLWECALREVNLLLIKKVKYLFIWPWILSCKQNNKSRAAGLDFLEEQLVVSFRGSVIPRGCTQHLTHATKAVEVIQNFSADGSQGRHYRLGSIIDLVVTQ